MIVIVIVQWCDTIVGDRLRLGLVMAMAGYYGYRGTRDHNDRGSDSPCRDSDEEASTTTSATGSSSSHSSNGVQLPYPGFTEVALRYLTQDTRPRNWCLMLITNPYPFHTFRSNFSIRTSITRICNIFMSLLFQNMLALGHQSKLSSTKHGWMEDCIMFPNLVLLYWLITKHYTSNELKNKPTGYKWPIKYYNSV